MQLSRLLLAAGAAAAVFAAPPPPPPGPAPAPAGGSPSVGKPGPAGAPVGPGGAARPPSPSSGPAPAPASSVNGALFFNSTAAQQYYVGNEWPTVPFPVPESWAGMLPLARSGGDKSYFFQLWAGHTEDAIDDVTVWLNGGPGCSSLEGAYQENGPVLFPWNVSGFPDQPYVYANNYSWHKLSNMVYVEQPLGTGFTGNETPDAQSETDIANDFYAFLTTFFQTFPELKGKRLWITGESYAGKYIPYIASGIYNRSAAENAGNGISLQGIAINDPSFTSDFFGEEAASIEFAKKWQADMLLSDAFIAKLEKEAAKYNFTDYVAKNLVYPPPAGGIPLPEWYTAETYDPWGEIYTQASKKNANFNVYNVARSNATLDPLGFPPAASNPSASNIFNNITGFKQLLHAPDDVTWYECSVVNVFPTGDASPPPDASVLPGVIERSVRTLIQHGRQDFILLADGSALAIQNMTWAGARGFQNKPIGTLIVDGKPAGSYHAERNLTFIQVDGSGHMIPQDNPQAAYKNFQYLLGKITYDQLGA